MNTYLSEKHYQALIAVSQSLSATTQPEAIKHLGRIANHLLRVAEAAGGGTGSSLNSQDLSPLAKRILVKCAGQTMNSRAIAMACGKTPGGSAIKKALKQLVVRGMVVRSGATGSTEYAIPAKS